MARHSSHRTRRHRVLGSLSVALVFTLVFGGSAVALMYQRFQGNISQYDINSVLGEDRPVAEPTDPADPNAGRALNILLIGSDTREGANDVDGAGESGTTSGMRSDTTMLAHVSADRTRMEIVSIPRDTLVDIPACPQPDGTSTRPQADVMFNSAFQTGGRTGAIEYAAACTILTVEQLTGLYVDDFVVVDFTGFKSVVDALGGIPMYIPEDVDDNLAGLQIQQGCRLLDGEQALGLARARKSLGDGSDISRIGRQQELVFAAVDEILSSRLLRQPTRLYHVLDVSTQTVTAGSTIGNLGTLVGLASSLADIRLDNVVMVTMPFQWAGARVTEAEEYATQVWDAIRADAPVDPVLTGDANQIAVAVAEREAAAQATPSPPVGSTPDSTQPAPTPAPASAGSTATEAPAGPALTCTRETAA